MNKKNKLEQLCDEAPSWVISLLSLTCLMSGGIVLWATWFFYKDIYTAPSFHWYNWLQPALMVLVGFMCLIASALLTNRKPAGWHVLWTAISIIPIILFLRLVIVIIRFFGYATHWAVDNAGRITDGNFFNQLSISPINIANIVVVAAIILVSVLNRASNKKNT